MRVNLLDVVTDFKKELTAEWPGKNTLSPISIFQCCLKLGSGNVKYIFLDLALHLTVNWKPN